MIHFHEKVILVGDHEMHEGLINTNIGDINNVMIMFSFG